MPTLTGLTGKRTQRQRLSGVSSATRQWGDADAFDFDRDTRVDRYVFNRAMLDNKAYRLSMDGGFRELVLKQTFGIDCATETNLVGVYNPVRVIVDCYQNCLRGSFGQDIKVDEQVDGRDVNPALVEPVSASMPSPIRQLWKWSNLDTDKHTLQEWAANLGSVGLRVVARNNTEPDQRRISIQLDYPGAITDFNEDDRGNITEVELKYPIAVGELGQTPQIVQVREILTKDRFVKEIEGANVLESDQQRNELGVCPYVLLRHRDDGHEFGRWAYAGSEDIIHWINWIATNQGESIVEHAWPEWFAAAGGKAPEEFQFGRTRVKYVQMNPDTPPPLFEPKVADLNYAGALAYTVELIGRLAERNPEIIIASISALAGQSGETIAQLRIPTESAILRARTQYESALIRALQIGLSEGVRMGVWDLGAGSGDVDAADATYRQGLEEFAFAQRAALPPSVFDRINQASANAAEEMSGYNKAKAAQGIGFPQLELYKIAGKSDAEAAALLGAKKKEQADAAKLAAATAPKVAPANLDPRVKQGMLRIAARAGRNGK